MIESGLCARSMQIDYDDDTANLAVQKIYDLARTPELKPFFLTVSFTHPHNPFVTTAEYWDRYRPEDIDMPRVPAIPWERQDGHSRRLHHLFRLDEYRVTEADTRNARHAYYRVISYLDDKLGQLMRALEASGLAEVTLVVFTADHGEMVGERGLWLKQAFFENSVRVAATGTYRWSTCCRHSSSLPPTAGRRSSWRRRTGNSNHLFLHARAYRRDREAVNHAVVGENPPFARVCQALRLPLRAGLDAR